MAAYDLQATLREVIEFAREVESEAARGRAVFDADKYSRTLLEHNLLLLGEAVSRVREPLRALIPAVPWEQVVGLRNAMIHGYDRVNREVVWEAATQDVPVLRAAVEEILVRLTR